jgi:hypothetical protein
MTTEIKNALTEAALDARARRAAKRVGLVARKSTWRRDSIDNYGEFMLVDPDTNFPQAGFTYDMSAEDVVKFCHDDASEAMAKKNGALSERR